MKCSRCSKSLLDNEIFTLAKTHNKFFIVQGVMKGSYTQNELYFCQSCAEKMLRTIKK